MDKNKTPDYTHLDFEQSQEVKKIASYLVKASLLVNNHASLSKLTD